MDSELLTTSGRFVFTHLTLLKSRCSAGVDSASSNGRDAALVNPHRLTRVCME
jgi:hypothetical protein